MSAVYTQERLKAMADSRRALYCLSLCKRITTHFLESSTFANLRPWTNTYVLDYDIEALDILKELRKTFPDISIHVYPDGVDTATSRPCMTVWIHVATPKKPEDA